MKIMISVQIGFVLLLVALLSATTLVAPARAETNAFRTEFIRNYEGRLLKQQELLVMKNKEIMPGEVDSLISEAMAEDKSFRERMYLLDIASAIASMYKYWHGDDSLVAKVRVIIDKEVKAEKARTAELFKWKKMESFLGNFVMKQHSGEMEAAGVAPVIYPHWIHRIWFQCKVCHNDIFTPKRFVDDINQKSIVEGKQCGVCHNNELAFGADKDCEKCHNAGLAGTERLYDITKIDNEGIKEVAEKLGAEWNPENLPDGKLPVDRFKFIDWLQLETLGAFKPVNKIDHDENSEVRDNMILFKSKSSFVNNVLFSHKVHSTWIKCVTCHPFIFKEELGSNVIKMIEMSRGENCGHCHGRVSFTFADCLRCHSQPQDAPLAEGVLVHDGSAHDDRVHDDHAPAAPATPAVPTPPAK